MPAGRPSLYTIAMLFAAGCFGVPAFLAVFFGFWYGVHLITGLTMVESILVTFPPLCGLALVGAHLWINHRFGNI